MNRLITEFIITTIISAVIIATNIAYEWVDYVESVYYVLCIGFAVYSLIVLLVENKRLNKKSESYRLLAISENSKNSELEKEVAKHRYAKEQLEYDNQNLTREWKKYEDMFYNIKLQKHIGDKVVNVKTKHKGTICAVRLSAIGNKFQYQLSRGGKYYDDKEIKKI